MRAPTRFARAVACGVVIASTGMASAILARPAAVADAQASQAPIRGVHGSTAASAYWWQQGETDCAPMSARVVIAAMTGVIVSPFAIDATAASVAGYGPDGTTWARMPALLGEYGVASHVAYNATLNDMRTVLDTVGPVIVLLNGETVWSRFEDWIASPGSAADHAVVLERVDDVAHTVTMVDSGTYRAETVPTPVFLEAWAASGYSAIMPTHAP